MGRPKKIKPETPETPVQPVSNEQQQTNPGEIDTYLKEFIEQPVIDDTEKAPDTTTEVKQGRGRPKGGRFDKSFSSSIITGALFMLFIDLVIPALITLINNKVSKKKIRAEQLKLSNDQRKELEPIADEVAKQINLQGNPVTVLVASLAAIYLGNLMLLRGSK
jgi:hypothetical protein